MAEKKYIFTYQTLCSATGRTYIGYHSTNNINDGYIGCGVTSLAYANASRSVSHFIRAVKKYGYENFKVQILSFFDTLKEAKEEEKFLVDRNWVDSKDNYNIAEGGFGGSGKSTTIKQDEAIFKDFMSGMSKKDIFKKHNTTHGVLWRITSCRDVSNRINPADLFIKNRKATRDKWIEENKDFYIKEYKSRRMSKADINEFTPFWLFKNDFLKGIKQNPNYFIYHNDKVKSFNSVIEFKKITGEDTFIQEFSRCDRELTATVKGFIIAKSKERLEKKIDAIKNKKPTSKYTGTVVFLGNTPYTIESSLDEFCKNHNVNRTSFGMMLNGTSKSAGGFVLVKKKHRKLIKNNEIAEVIGEVKSFCKDRDIPLSSYYALWDGRMKQANGYSIYNG